MPYETSKAIRRAYVRAFFEGVAIAWPVLSALLAIKALLGVIVGSIEGWGIWNGIYFAFITGMTIGYGDLVPRSTLTQILSILIGFTGIVLAGLIAALAVKAFRAMPSAVEAGRQRSAAR